MAGASPGERGEVILMVSRILVLGAAGGFGRAVVAEFASRGWLVRGLVRRPPAPGTFSDALDLVEGDARDRTVLAQAAQGCAVVALAVNTPFAQWEAGMRDVTAKAIATCRETGALLLYPGSVHGFGRQTGRALSEDAPQDAMTRKGRLRADLEYMIRRACDDGRMRAIIVRAGDFFGPGVRNGLVDRLFARAIAGRPMLWPGRLSMPHQWAYVPDLARLAGDLVGRRDDLAPCQAVHLSGHVFTRQGDFLAAIAVGAGLRGRVARTVPWWALRLAAPFDPALREMLEFDYLFEDAVILDDPARRRLLPGFQTTDLQAAIAATLADYRGRV
jgi:nucleoside-diphosphate-sugar epimerase